VLSALVTAWVFSISRPPLSKKPLLRQFYFRLNIIAESIEAFNYEYSCQNGSEKKKGID